MKQWNWILRSLTLAGLIALGVAACNDVPQPAAPQPGAAPVPVDCSTPPVAVSIPQNAQTLDQFAFGPNPLVVPVGTMVTWTNNDSVAHQVEANDGSFSSPVLQPGGTFQFTFTDVGDYPYYDPIFGQVVMSGLIRVVALPAACASPSPSPSPSESPSPSPSEAPSPSPSEAPSPAPSAAPSQAPGTAGMVTVAIGQNAAGMGPAAYGANPMVVPVGSQVVWMNQDSVAHTATSDQGIFDTGSITPGTQSQPVPFNTPGDFSYHCSIHGQASMSGVIHVQ